MKNRGIVGLKDSGTFNHLKSCLEIARDTDFRILAGKESFILKGLKLGSVGAASALANIFTEKLVSLYRSFSDGKLEETQKIQESLSPLIDSFLNLNDFVTAIEISLKLMGICDFYSTHPFGNISASEKSKISELLRKEELLKEEEE